MPIPKLLTVRELAAALRVSPREANRIAKKLTHVRLGRRILVAEDVVAGFVEAHTRIPDGIRATAHTHPAARKRTSSTPLASNARRPIEVRTLARPRA